MKSSVSTRNEVICLVNEMMKQWEQENMDE
jgi:hypothetical protein